jgi:hypothetical protein
MDGSVTCTEVVRDHVRIGADAHRVGAPPATTPAGCAHGRRTAMTGLGPLQGGAQRPIRIWTDIAAGRPEQPPQPVLPDNSFLQNSE